MPDRLINLVLDAVLDSPEGGEGYLWRLYPGFACREVIAKWVIATDTTWVYRQIRPFLMLNTTCSVVLGIIELKSLLISP